MNARVYHVLFLSRQNSARSVLAAAILNKCGKGKFRAYSAGVDPAKEIDPNVIDLVLSSDLPMEAVRPRHFAEFARADAQELDFVFTLSDTAAGVPLPDWPGQPVAAHWSSPDPLLVEGAEWERKLAIGGVFDVLERRLSIFMHLSFDSLDRISLKRRLDDIGAIDPTVTL